MKQKKFKIGDYVKVIKDNTSYQHCVGKIGRITSVSEKSNIYRLKFDFKLPPNFNNHGQVRDFREDELGHPKEYYISKLLKEVDAIDLH